MTNATIDAQQVGIEKSILRLILKICKFQGGLITALALEAVAAEIRTRSASVEGDRLASP